MTCWPVREDSVRVFEQLPFSAPFDEGRIAKAAAELATILEIRPQFSMLNLDAGSALLLESDLRRSWWNGRPDPFQDGIHRLKRKMHAASCDPSIFTQAWSSMRAHVEQSMWRDHIRRLCRGRADFECAYVRRAVRWAQQLWTRAVRWETSLAAEPNPFSLMVEFIVNSVWPVGFWNGALQVIHVSLRDRPALDGIDADGLKFKPAAASNKGGVFLSGPFRDEFTNLVLMSFNSRGFTAIHGRVDETSAPEHQIGERIKCSCACVAAVERNDPDFGVPWWTFQELDFGMACGRPVAVICREPSDSGIGNFLSFGCEQGAIDEAFWSWLEDRC